MSINTGSTTVSRRPSLSNEEIPKPRPNPKYKQIFNEQRSLGSRGYNPRQRLDANTHFKQELSLKLLKTINGTKWTNGSYFFTPGKQLIDQRFQEVFINFFREMRGSDPLAIDAAISLSNRFRGYSDVSSSSEHTIDCGDFSDIQTTYYSPTQEIINELREILEKEHGLQGQFLSVLNLSGRRIGTTFRADTRDTCFYDVPIFSRLFPKCVDTLREVFNSLLLKQWLQSDIDGVKLYLKENISVDRPIPSLEDITLAIKLWETAKEYGEKQKQRYVELSNKHRNELKDDISGIAISGGLSFITGNPSFVIGKAAQTVMNTLGNKVDPEGKDQAVKVLKLFGGVGLGGVMGGNPWDLGTSLGIDLMDLATRGDKTGKGESALRNLGGSLFKGALTADKKKLVCQILGGCVAEAANQIPETTEDTPLDVRIARALLTNSDVQAHWIKGFVEKRFKDDPKPKVDGILTPEDPKQEPTLEDLERTAEYEKWQADSAAQTLAETNARNELIQKEAGVGEAQKHYDEKYDKGQKIWGPKQAREAEKKITKAENNLIKANRERDTAQKKLDDLLGIVKIPIPEPKPKKPKTVVGKVWKWTKDNVSVSGEISVASTPLYTTRQSTATDRHVPIETPQAPNNPQVTQNNVNIGQWERVQAMQQEQMFERNMAYQSPVQPSSMNYQQFWGQGLNPNVQIPPSDFSNLGREPIQSALIPRNRQIQLAGFVEFQPMIEPSEAMHSLLVNDFTKSMPKGAAKVMAAVCTLMLPDMSDIAGAEDPREHFKRAFNYGLKKYDQLVQIQDPNSFGSKAGEFVGEMVALGGVGKVIRVAEGISVLGMACEGGFVGAIMSEAHETNMVAGIAFGFAGGGAVSGVRLLFRGGGIERPLLDRMLLRPGGFGRQLRNTEIQQVLRCGFVSDKTVMRLTEREIKAITPFKLPSVRSGSELTWLSENAPKITQLRQVKGVDKFDQFLKATFRGQELSENQIRRLLNYSEFNTYHKPMGLPSEVMVEFAKKNGGMIYRKIGSSNPENLVVRVCPGLAEESIVSSVHKGNHLNGKLNGTLRQQCPYVVQTRGKLKLTIHGEWIETSLSMNKGKEGLTHLPLETYQFKGW